MISNQMSFINRTRQLIRRCSCCRSSQHTIMQCNDPNLLNFGTLLVNRRNELREIYTIDLYDKISFFKTWLQSQNQVLIKSYAIKFCGAYSRNNFQTCVDKIINFIWNIQTNTDSITNDQGHTLLSQMIHHDYVAFPTATRQNSLNSLDIILIESLVELRNIPAETSENRKYDITGVLYFEEPSKDRTTTKIIEELESLENCNICYDDKKNRNMVSLNCRHTFCGDCVSQILKRCSENKHPNCALCRSEIDLLIVKDEETMDMLKENLV